MRLGGDICRRGPLMGQTKSPPHRRDDRLQFRLSSDQAATFRRRVRRAAPMPPTPSIIKDQVAGCRSHGAFCRPAARGGRHHPSRTGSRRPSACFCGWAARGHPQSL